MRRQTLPCIITALITSFVGSADAASVPWYHYHRDTLILRFWARTEAVVSVQWQAVAKDGRPNGPVQRQRFETKRGANQLKLPVGKAGGHRVQLRVDDRNIRVWCNRGVWAAGPGALDIERVRSGKAIALPYRYVGLADIQLARGFQANVRAVTAAAPLALERSFGYPKSLGIRPPAGMALVWWPRARSARYSSCSANGRARASRTTTTSWCSIDAIGGS